jgi:hypothetical protein
MNFPTERGGFSGSWIGEFSQLIDRTKLLRTVDELKFSAQDATLHSRPYCEGCLYFGGFCYA